VYVSPSTTMSRPAIASAAEAMRPDARCEIVEQMRQLLETAQALLIALTELARRHTHPRVRDRHRRSGAEEVTEVGPAVPWRLDRRDVGTVMVIVHGPDIRAGSSR
jgi:hypothetical protein